MSAEPGATSLWSSLVQARRERLGSEGQWRPSTTFDGRGPEGVLVADGTKVVSFATNDYLGLSLHPTVVAAAHEALDHWGTSAGAGRLVAGSHPLHDELESALATWKATERAALFPTRLAAHLGVLDAFGDRGVRICCDELDHAGIVDAARRSHAEVALYRHRDVEHLEHLLRAATGPAIVVTEVVFAMDGDIAPVEDIASACRRRGALLVLDEAHVVIGPDIGLVLDDVDTLRVGTLSKALGSVGGFAAGRGAFVDLLTKRAPSYIFSTPPTPPDSAAALAALHLLSSPEGDRLRTRLMNNIRRVAPGHPSPIIPIVLGTSERAVTAAAALRDHGVWVPAIGPPLVPPGTARLRVTLSAAHTSAHIALLLDALAAVPSSPGDAAPEDGAGPASTSDVVPGGSAEAVDPR
jgi:7-keto-8-aminopelargonate synthetase-like enzyme